MSSVAFIYDPIFLEPKQVPLDIIMQVPPSYHIELIEEKSLYEEAIDANFNLHFQIEH